MLLVAVAGSLCLCCAVCSLLPDLAAPPALGLCQVRVCVDLARSGTARALLLSKQPRLREAGTSEAKARKQSSQAGRHTRKTVKGTLGRVVGTQAHGRTAVNDRWQLVAQALTAPRRQQHEAVLFGDGGVDDLQLQRPELVEPEDAAQHIVDLGRVRHVQAALRKGKGTWPAECSTGDTAVVSVAW